MALTSSTGLRNYIITSGFKSAFDTTGRLAFYTGAAPARDAAETGTLLATFTLAATAFGTASSGATVMANVTSVTAAASGTPGHFMFYLTGDTAPTSPATTTDRRLTGTVGTSGADINFDSTTWVSGGTVAITNGSVSWTAPA